MKHPVSCTTKTVNIHTGEDERITPLCFVNAALGLQGAVSAQPSYIMVHNLDCSDTITLPIINDVPHISLATLAQLLSLSQWEIQIAMGELVELSIIPVDSIGWKWQVVNADGARIPVPHSLPLMAGHRVAKHGRSLRSGMISAWLSDAMREWLDEKMRKVEQGHYLYQGETA